MRELLEEQLGLYAYQANVGKQLTYGLEGAVRLDRPHYRALANFSWSRAKREYEPALGRGWQPYGLDQPLRLNMLLSTSARRWNIGGRLAVASGNPIEIVPDGAMYDFESDREPARVLQRLPMFWQVDVRVSRTWKTSWGNAHLFFDIQNITNHRNVEYRESIIGDDNRYTHRDVLGLPIIPYIGVEFAPR